MVLVFLGGVGVAAFHPQGTAIATTGVKENRGRAMAFFISSGTLGFAMGPTYFAALAEWIGLERMYWAAIPGVVATVLLWLYLPRGEAPRTRKTIKSDWGPILRYWKPIGILFLLVFIRSTIQVTFAQLLPLYMNLERGYTLVSGNYIVTMYTIFGAIGGFLGGTLADRFGGRQVILWSLIGCLPFLLLFFLTRGVPSIIGLCLGGLILLFTIPVNVVMGQELVPEQGATISSLLMGFAWGTAGLIFVPLTGVLADQITMHYSLMLLLVFPAIGALLTLRLPKTLDEQRRM
jgi:FSR family fosmidomycin resistance protein-like MFS transporter